MTGKLFFAGDREWEHPGHTCFWNFALIPFGEFMVLLKFCIRNAYLHRFLDWLSPRV